MSSKYKVDAVERNSKRFFHHRYNTRATLR